MFNLFKKKKKHIWKETSRENLGSFIDFGCSPHDINTIYRIAIYEECLLSGEKRIREIRDLFPAECKR
jgi:hypothetical protein